MNNFSPQDIEVIKGDMVFSGTSIPFKQTGYFTKIVSDYLEEAAELKPFFRHPVSYEGIAAAIDERKSLVTDRETLVSALNEQYASLPVSASVKSNIERLSEDTTFTITTAHQPNIFTGYLYFIYKILHTIKLAATLNKQFPGNYFVPVFYMGSEDADLEELGKIFMNGEKIKWDTEQQGAVGRMNTKGLEKIIQRLEGELSVQPFGNELIDIIKRAYLSNNNIQAATLQLVNTLFADYGLVVLMPDNPRLKKLMLPVFTDDLLHQTASGVVQQTIDQLSEYYKVQANPREINLFYLKDNTRERIVRTGDEWRVIGTDIRFNESALMQELQHHPERFSPNVILRGLFQETILPNIVFIGGGGELAYWLELKALFAHYQKPFPVLMLRNSFLIILNKWKDKMNKLGLNETDLLKQAHQQEEILVKSASSQQLQLQNEIEQVNEVYEKIKGINAGIDKSLNQHIEALQTKTNKDLHKLEKKMLKAEKKKYESQLRQLASLRSALFPADNLQERIDNFMPYYAKYGKSFIDMLYHESPALSKAFILLTENSKPD